MPYINPLEYFGVPKWFVEEQLRRTNTTAGLEQIREAAKATYRVLSRIYHPDGGTDPDIEKFKEISGLYEVLANLPSVEVLAKQMTDTGSLYTEQSRRLVAEAERLSRTRLDALLGMCGVMSQAGLLGLPLPVELVFGLPLDLAAGVQTLYDKTYIFQPEEVGEGRLSYAQHPYDMVLAPISYDEPVVWDEERGCWRTRYRPSEIRFLLDGVAPLEHYHTEPPHIGDVRLVGGLPQGLVYDLAATMQRPDPDVKVLGPGGMPAIPGPDLWWFTPDKAWWMGEIRPTIGMGDFAVVTRTRTAQPMLALAGRLIAKRSLA